jgi:hypothetical protein
MELSACPECGAPAEVIPTEGTAPPGASGAPTHRLAQIVGVRCVRRHWFLGLRDRLVA